MIPLIYHAIYSDFPLPEGHRYPKNKYRYLYELVVQQQALSETWKERFQIFEPVPVTRAEVVQSHDETYVDHLLEGTMPAAKMRRIGFPWSERLMERTLTSSGGTCLTAELAVKHGVAIHLSGGYHHAHKDFGSGFCMFNDLFLAAQRAISQLPNIEKVLIVDADVHHGDGTATMANNRDDIITLSFHCDKNFPARKPDSHLDVPLARETGDEEFLQSFREVVDLAINLHQPDMVIYDAGVDIHIDDELGYFNVTTQGIYQRDEYLLTQCRDFQIPVACVVGGGYRSEHRDLVPIHRQLLESALHVFESNREAV